MDAELEIEGEDSYGLCEKVTCQILMKENIVQVRKKSLADW